MNLAINFGLLLIIFHPETECRKMFKIESVKYLLRMTNITHCAAANRKAFIENVRFKTYNLQQYVLCDVNLVTDITVQSLNVRIERCSNDGNACEYFQSWNFTNVCSTFMMKNQIWSPVIETTYPKISCPHIKKNMYKIINATIDVDKVVQFWPEAVKYRWKGDAKYFDIQKKPIHCVRAEGHVISYTRKIPIL